jgi:hypothetical protein
MKRHALSAVVTFLICNLLMAGEVTVNYITEKEQPYKRLPKDGLQNLTKTYGQEKAKELWAHEVEMSKKNPMHYSITLGNTDKIRKATHVDLLIEFYDRLDRKIGEKLASFDREIPPDDSKNVTIDCDQYGDMCKTSHSVFATVKKTTWVELKYGTGNEIAFEWKDTRWYLENAWDKEKKITLRSFSGAFYGDKGFDGKIFPADGVGADAKRFYKVVKEPIPAGFASDSTYYELNAYWFEAMPGFIVENGQKKNPRFLDTQISNDKVQGTIAVGEYIQIKNASADKNNVELAIAPVCQLGNRHRALIGKIRFFMGRDRVKDAAAIDEAIHAWLEPVSVGEVAKSCGPNSGRLVRRWDASTTAEQIETDLGPAEARSEVKGGEVLVYGSLRLKFVDGKLAGFERKVQ